jgi:hypothetical protein
MAFTKGLLGKLICGVNSKIKKVVPALPYLVEAQQRLVCGTHQGWSLKGGMFPMLCIGQTSWNMLRCLLRSVEFDLVSCSLPVAGLQMICLWTAGNGSMKQVDCLHLCCSEWSWQGVN